MPKQKGARPKVGRKLMLFHANKLTKNSESAVFQLTIDRAMDKNLDWKLLCFNVGKTTNAAFLLSSDPLTKK